MRHKIQHHLILLQGGRIGVGNYPGSAVGRSSYAPQAPTPQYGKGGKVAPSKKK